LPHAVLFLVSNSPHLVEDFTHRRDALSPLAPELVRL
jgi:hypothetical protein